MDKEHLMALAKEAFRAYQNAQLAQQQGAGQPPQHIRPPGAAHAYSDEGAQTDEPPPYQQQNYPTGGNHPVHRPQPIQTNSGSHLSPEQAEQGAQAARVHANSPLPPDNPLAGALGLLMQHLHEGSHEVPVDEHHVQQAHAQAYNQGGGANMSAGSMGTAAAMQILQHLSSSHSGPGGNAAGGSGPSQADLIHLAMSEAAKLFDKSGGAASGNKQDAINNAAMTVMKLLVQSKTGAGAQGGAQGGTAAGLMSLMSKFA